jgi:hypothetical protein
MKGRRKPEDFEWGGTFLLASSFFGDTSAALKEASSFHFTVFFKPLYLNHAFRLHVISNT